MPPTSDRPDKVAFIGFGEAARAFLSGWGADRPHVVAALDVKTADPAAQPAMLDAYRAHDVEGHDEASAALAGAEAAFSLVTADQSPVAAAQAGPHLGDGAWHFDGNSCAPQTKQRAAELIARHRGRYVDMAIMAPVHPLRHRVPILISGPEAEEALGVLGELGFVPKLAGDARPAAPCDYRLQLAHHALA